MQARSLCQGKIKPVAEDAMLPTITTVPQALDVRSINESGSLQASPTTAQKPRKIKKHKPEKWILKRMRKEPGWRPGYLGSAERDPGNKKLEATAVKYIKS
jgi:hypothetical protein